MNIQIFSLHFDLYFFTYAAIAGIVGLASNSVRENANEQCENYLFRLNARVFNYTAVVFMLGLLLANTWLHWLSVAALGVAIFNTIFTEIVFFKRPR